MPACASVLVIESSSPPEILRNREVASPTSFQRRRASSSKQPSASHSSSPGLPSPSTFAKAVDRTKSASQQQGAEERRRRREEEFPGVGFTSAGSLWRAAALENGREQTARDEGARSAEQIVDNAGESAGKHPGRSVVTEVAEGHDEGIGLPPSAQRAVRTRSPGVDLGPTKKAVAKKAVRQPKKKTAADADFSESGQKPRKRLKKSESIVINSDEPPAAAQGQPGDTVLSDAAGEVSRHFANPQQHMAMSDAVVAAPITEPVPDNSLPRASTPTRPNVLLSAEPQVAESPASDAGVRSLSAVLGNLGYDAAAAVQTPRADTGEAFTKRRRIELAETVTVDLVSNKKKRTTAADSPAVAGPSAKKAKKRPLTITELATAAYRPPEVVADDGAPISAYFPPAPEAPAALPAPTSNQEPEASEPATAKKPRKSRARKIVVVAADGTILGPKPPKPPKTPKIKKPKGKVKFREEDPPLLSPQQARRVELAQSILFGTSSQLANDESPQYIRDMQLAIQISEAPPSSQVEAGAMLPPGRPRTSIRIGMATRGLWRSATRDDEGELHVSQSKLAVVEEGEEENADQDEGRVPAGPADALIDVGDDSVMVAAQSDEFVQLQSSPPIVEEEPADLPALPEAGANAAAEPRVPTVFSQTAPRRTPTPPSSMPVSDDNWMLLQSDSSVVAPVDATQRSPRGAAFVMPTLQRAATCPMLRSPLRMLDRNMPVFRPLSPQKGLSSPSRQFLSTTAVAALPRKTDAEKKSRGRPKELPSAETEPAEPNKRGRPKKLPDAEAAEMPAPKKRGRPKKADADTAGLVSPKKRGRPKKAALDQLSPPALAGPSVWTNIDEIFDSEPDATPSPPRRRATSSPPVVQPLTLAPSPTKARPLPASIKNTDPVLAHIKATLFPQITRAVRSTPPSTAFNAPTWHEKMLLYDPIVLEDLTAWLNAQGVRNVFERAKKVPKSKGKRKKKDDELQQEDAAAEMETVEAEVQPWMVQKWCEEKSVCCLWKSGLRGGVRTRY